MDVLAKYDLFQFHNNIKPDYCNVGGIAQWCDDSDGDGTPGWEDWYDEDTCEDDPVAFLALQDGGSELEQYNQQES